MKITLVSSGSGSRGGGEIYLRFLAEGLGALGHEVQALVPSAARMDELAQMLSPVATVQRFAFTATYDRRLRSLGAVADRAQKRRLSALFAGLDTDILHLNQQVAEDGLDLIQAARRSGMPWVSTIHVGHSARALKAQLGTARDLATAAVIPYPGGHFVAVSNSSAEQLRARFPNPRTHLHTVHNGVPVPPPEALAAARATARAEWGVQDGDIVLGTVGRIEAQKNPLALISHLAPIAAAHPERRLRLVWIGDGSLRQDLETAAAAHTKHLPLVVDGWRSDAAWRLAGLDAFVLPSVFEGLPLALLEAMHAGLPVVASHADGIAEAVTDGATGMLCHRDADWNTALTRLITDAGLRHALGTAAHKVALAQFSTQAMAAQSYALYETVIPKTP